jgi:hypothetical protein
MKCLNDEMASGLMSDKTKTGVKTTLTDKKGTNSCAGKMTMRRKTE